MGETSASMSFSGLKETTDTVLRVFKDVMTESGIPAGQNRPDNLADAQRHRPPQ